MGALETSIAAPASIDPHGNIQLACTSRDLRDAGFSAGDLVQIHVYNHTLSLPMLPHFRLVAPGEDVLVAWDDPTRPVRLATFYGNFAQKYDLSASSSFPIPLQISLCQHGAYSANLDLLHLKRSTHRSDYPHLSDAEFANFRVVAAPDLKPGLLYRASSPFQRELGRHSYVDQACQQAGIQTIINMATSREKSAFDAAPYCAKATILFLPMSVDVASPTFERDLACAFHFLATNAPPILLHCTEGQDRTGFACAILQAACGASLQQITEDYLLSFRNYYGTTPGSPAEQALSTTLARLLERALGAPLPDSTRDLQAAARRYLRRIGFDPALLESLLTQK